MAVVGTLSGGLRRPGIPPLSDLGHLLLPALGILVVGYTDNVLTARAFASHGGYAIDANQELLALGACNLGSALGHGFPVSSSASRTALGVAAGSRSQLYSLTALGTVLIVVAFLRPALAHLPVAALGGLVIYAAARLIDIAEFRRLARFRRREVVLAVAATVGVLAFDILYGVLLAVAMSVIELLWRVARPHDAVLGSVPGLEGMHDIDDYPQATEVAGLLIYRYNAPLFFANAEDFRRRALETVDRHQGKVTWFVLNVEAIVEVDITGLDALESVRSKLAGSGIMMALAHVKLGLLDDLEAYGLAESIGPDRLFPTLPATVTAYHEWCRVQRDGAASS